MPSLKSHYSDKTHEAGCDEVGRGCLAGPVVAAAVILPKQFTSTILTDSKQLTDIQRRKLKTEIEVSAIAYAIAEVDHEEIDRINILNASVKAMGLAIAKLNPVPEFLLIDGNRYPGYPNIPHKCIVKGDSKYFSIAAASVLAKVYRDDLMIEWAKKYPHYDWENNAGYATKKHKSGLSSVGPSSIHRKSFLKSDSQIPLFD